MCMTFQLNKTPFLALELPRFLTFDMDQLAKHRRHHLKKRLKISKIANFESDTFSASEDIALQVAKFYRRLYGGGGGGGGGGGAGGKVRDATWLRLKAIFWISTQEGF